MLLVAFRPKKERNKMNGRIRSRPNLICLTPHLLKRGAAIIWEAHTGTQAFLKMILYKRLRDGLVQSRWETTKRSTVKSKVANSVLTAGWDGWLTLGFSRRKYIRLNYQFKRVTSFNFASDLTGQKTSAHFRGMPNQVILNLLSNWQITIIYPGKFLR